MTYAEYLAAEERSSTKHEYWAGEIRDMAGGTLEHAALAAAFAIQLGIALAGRPCRVFSSDARVRIRADDVSTYPDVTVVCGRLETAPEDAHAITNPILIVEVLSDGTEAHDRGDKAATYRHISSLKEYVLVAQQQRRIEVYRKNAEGRWELFEFGGGDKVELAAVGCAIGVDDVYRDPLAPTDLRA
jgi:Uma2 family endonuclease